MKLSILSIIAVLFMTLSVNAAKTVNPIISHVKPFVKTEVSEKPTYTISYNVNETKEWCWVEWTVTITWSDGTTSSYSGTTGNANGCGAAINSALGTIGRIVDAVMQ